MTEPSHAPASVVARDGSNFGIEINIWAKWVLGIIATVLLTGSGAGIVTWANVRTLESKYTEDRKKIEANTKFRMQGDRVTPDDLDKMEDRVGEAIAKALSRHDDLIEQQTAVIGGFTVSMQGINDGLRSNAQTIARIDEKVDILKSEQDRLRSKNQ